MKNTFLLSLLLLAVYAEATSGIAGNNAAYFYTSLLARSVFIPSAYLYFRNRINNASLSVQDLFHLLPFCLMIVAGVFIYSDVTGGVAVLSPGSSIQSVMLLLIYITTGFYFLKLLLLFKRNARSWFEKEVSKNYVMQVDTDKRPAAVVNSNIALTEKQMLRMDQLVNEYLEANKPFLQHRYSLKDLAEGTNIPLHHLSAFINRHHGFHFNDFINGYRVEYCKQKILNGECEQKKLEAIAQESGFSNRNTFTSAFKKVTGVNPSEFVKISQIPARQKPAERPEMKEEPSSVPLRYTLAVDQYS